MRFRRLVSGWVGVFALPLLSLVLLPVRKGWAEEKPVALDRFVVSEKPFGVWGICWSAKNPISNLAGFGSASSYHVTAVSCDSPADKAGVQAGDEILNLNGKAASSYPYREVKRLFHESNAGDRIKIGAYNCLTSRENHCELQLDSGLKWDTPGKGRLNYWGVRLVWTCAPQPELELRVKKDRRLIVKQKGKKYILIERPGQGVELIEGKQPGRMLPTGTSVQVEKDGSLTIEPPKPTTKDDNGKVGN